MAKKVKDKVSLLKDKVPSSFGKIPKIVRTDKVLVLKNLNTKEEKEDIELAPLLYGKGQGGKGRGLMQELPVEKKKKEEEPFKMGTTTAKASWRR